MTLRLYIIPKTIVFAGRVSEPSAVTYPRDYFDYDGVTTGTTGNVRLNHTVLIGSSAGAFDLGITRARLFPTSTRMYIGRSSQGTGIGEVTLTDNAYFSVLSEHRIWSKTPYIDTAGVTYMDSGLDFATWGASSPPVANAGPAVAGTIDSGTSVLTVNFSAGNSFVSDPGATIASYTWNVGAGTITVGTSADEDITATFPAGLHSVSLLVADDNAAYHYAYATVLAIDPAADPCLYNFEITRHTITPQGQELSIRIREDIDAATYLDGAYCMLIDGEPADADDRTNVVFQGWIETDVADIGATPTGLLRDVTLNLVDVAGRLKQLPGYSQIIEHAASPATWQEMTTPDIGRYLHFLAQWQSNALDLADFFLSGDEASYTFKALGSDGDSIFDQINRRANAMVPDYHLTCNRLGQLAIVADPMLQETGDRTSSTQATFSSAAYSDIRYSTQRNPRTHWLRSNAILAGTSTIGTAFCIAPGDAPGQGAGSVDHGEQLALSQDDLNNVTGHRYARLNSVYGLFTVTMSEPETETSLDPAALQWLKITIDSAVAAQRGLTFTEARFLVRQIDIRYSHGVTGLLKTVTIQAEKETSGTPAVTVTVPAAEAVDDGGWTPTESAETMFNNGLTGAGVVAMVDGNGYIWTTSDFDTGTPPTWSRNTSAASAASFSTNELMSFVVDPFSPGYRGTPGGAINAWVHGTSDVYRLTDIFGTPAYSSVKTFSEGANRTFGEWGVIAASFGRYQSTESDNPWLMSVRSHRNISGLNGVYASYSVDAGQTWSSEISVTGHYNTSTSNTPRRIAGVYMSPRTPGYALVGVYTSTGASADVDIYKTEDWGATWATSGIASDLGQQLGWCFHVPWEDNADESILYYTNFLDSGATNIWTLRRTDGTTDADISPTDSAINFAPYRMLFGIQSLDTDRLQMVMAGQGDEVDDIDIDQSGTDAVACIFVSDDGGDTWTKRMGPVTGGTNEDWPAQVAFASDNSDIIYAWGNEAIWYSTDNGQNWVTKTPGSEVPTQEVLGIAGGPTS